MPSLNRWPRPNGGKLRQVVGDCVRTKGGNRCVVVGRDKSAAGSVHDHRAAFGGGQHPYYIGADASAGAVHVRCEHDADRLTRRLRELRHRKDHLVRITLLRHVDPSTVREDHVKAGVVGSDIDGDLLDDSRASGCSVCGQGEKDEEGQ